MSLELKRIYFENTNTDNDYADYKNRFQPRKVFEISEFEFDRLNVEVL